MIRNKATSNGVKQSKQGRGFTLLELLIVIAIIAILSVILVLVLNPAETLKKSRDAQRISDLNTVKTALGLILTSSTTPYLSAGNIYCIGGTSPKLFVSTTGITSGHATGIFTGGINASSTTSVDGLGWIPVVFSWLTGGSPISNVPLDPINSATSSALVDTSLVYRYACNKTAMTFEVDGRLESDAYTIDDNKMTKDGGDNANLYEVGTVLTLIQ